jgi:hypothetical protein
MSQAKGIYRFWRNITGRTQKDDEAIQRFQANLEVIQKRKLTIPTSWPDLTFMFIRFEQENGDLVEFIALKFFPLNFEELKAAIKNEQSFEFRIAAENISVEKEDRRKELSENVVTMRINLRDPIPFYCLVDDGWLPMPFVKSRNFLIDYNVIVYLEKVVAGVVMQDSPQKDWWMQMMKDESVVINPLLYAFEGTEILPDARGIRRAFQRSGHYN